MRTVLNLFALVAALAAGRIAAKPLTLYVAPNGNDQWSGRVAKAAGGKDGPLASLPAALKAARQAGPQAQDGVTILLRGGLYQLDEPVTLTPDDSGASAKQPLTIAAYPGEKPVLSGGRRLSNDHYAMDRNIYFDTRAASNTVKFAGVSFPEWQQRGHDPHSLIADPMFVAPQKYDFRLQPDSPALKLGFRPINLSDVGVREKSKRN